MGSQDPYRAYEILDQLARRILDGTTTSEDTLTILKYSNTDILKSKIQQAIDWEKFRSSIDINTKENKNGCSKS